jgi:hypothetical protein
MSNIGYANDIFVGLTELNKTKSFLQDEGYQKFIKDNAISFGLLNNSIDGNFTNAAITEGTADNTIKHAAILGIDSDGKFIKKAASSDIAVSGSDTWYWVKMVRSESLLEDGTISISSSGVLTGTGTSFLSLLRNANSDYPTKIVFPNSALNTGEYDISSVTNNTTAQLNVVSMSAESDEEWRIIPTVTPNASLTTDEKKLFNYDSATISLVLETDLDDVNGDPLEDSDGTTLPEVVVGEYWLARVKNSGTDVVIEDKRSNYIFETVDGYFTSNLDKSANPLIGVEALKFAAITDPRDKNIVELAFGMRSSNWTADSNLNKVTIIGGNGGKFKDTDDFTNGDFDGWRLYYESGKYALIKTSTISASQINLTLDSLDLGELSNASQQLLIVPDCSEVEIFIQASATTPLSELKRAFPVNTDVCRIEVPVTAATANYVVKYRHKHIKDYGAILTIPNDATTGYYTEASYNDDGSLKALIDRVTATYTSGTITLTRASNAYSQRISNVESGDLFGVRTLTLDASTVNNQLIVGTNFKEQIFDGTVTLTDNKYINLRTTGAVAGNQFFLTFEADVTLDGNEFEVVQEWDGSSSLVDSGSSTNLTLLTLQNSYLEKSENDNLILKCVFDGTDWKVNPLSADIYTSFANRTAPETNINDSLLTVDLDSRGWVNINGSLSTDAGVGLGADPSSQTTVATLDSGFRPSVAEKYVAFISGNTGGLLFANITINTDGTIDVSTNTGSPTLWNLYLTGVRFRV